MCCDHPLLLKLHHFGFMRKSTGRFFKASLPQFCLRFWSSLALVSAGPTVDSLDNAIFIPLKSGLLLNMLLF